MGEMAEVGEGAKGQIGRKPLKGILKDNGVLIPPTEDVEGLTSRGYGVEAEGGLMLEFYEALYLLSRNIIEVTSGAGDGTVSFQDILDRFRELDENAWVRYIIYRDLRSRGYVVREGCGGVDFRVYERGRYGEGAAKYMVIGVREGKPLRVEELAKTLNNIQGLKKALILAVLNRRGEVVYYSLSKLTF